MKEKWEYKENDIQWEHPYRNGLILVVIAGTYDGVFVYPFSRKNAGQPFIPANDTAKNCLKKWYPTIHAAKCAATKRFGGKK